MPRHRSVAVGLALALHVALALLLLGLNAHSDLRQMSKPPLVVQLIEPPRPLAPPPAPPSAPPPAPAPAKAAPAAPASPQSRPSAVREPPAPTVAAARPERRDEPAAVAAAPAAPPAAAPAPAAPAPAVQTPTAPAIAAPTPAPAAVSGPAPSAPTEARGSGEPVVAAPRRVGPRVDASWAGNAAPAYPLAARRMGEQGTVRLDVHVGPDGTVLEVQVRQSSGSTALDRAATEAVRQWRFRPATVDGQPVAEWYRNWQWVFKLEG